MTPTFRQLRLLLALAEHGSISAAARARHVTQPTASMQLRELTRSIGLPLHELIGRRVHLTAAGEQLARTARAMADEWARFEQEIDGMRGLRRGRLRVAVVSTAKYFIPRWLGDFCGRYPSIDIALEVLNRDGVVQRLRENLDDLYVMSMPPPELELVTEELMPNRLLLVAPAGHALATRRELPLAALAGERFILRERGSGTRMACDEHFRRQRLTPQVRLELGSNEAIKQAIAGRLGVGVLSEHALAHPPMSEALTVLNVKGFPVAGHWYLVHPAGKRLSPIAAAFREYLLAAAATQVAAPAVPRARSARTRPAGRRRV